MLRVIIGGAVVALLAVFMLFEPRHVRRTEQEPEHVTGALEAQRLDAGAPSPAQRRLPAD